MKNEIDHKMILQVYQIICEKGQKESIGHLYEGLYAYTDFDGYTLYIEGSGVLMRFGFHNTYQLDYDSEKMKDIFFKKFESIQKQA